MIKYDIIIFKGGDSMGLSKKIKNKTGMTFGRLKVIEYAGQNIHYEAKWKCKCDCGNEIIVMSGQLMAGRVNSCKECKKEKLRNRMTTHGMTNTRLFHIWQGLRSRCNNPNDKNYKNYGGRGIIVDKHWNQSFESFYNWAINNGYKSNLTLDRTNVNGNYEPVNCRWATIKQQCNNTRVNRKVTINGVTKTVTEWADETGLKESTIRERLRHGYDGLDVIRTLRERRK